MNLFRRKAELETRFIPATGQANVRSELETLLSSGTKSLQIANCFLTEPGRILLSRHAKLLAKENSFFVASVAFPTDLEALAELHETAPGNVYIHLGGALPKEPHVGRALMHSKVFLAESDERSAMWVGSHNLTAMAIEGGNFEAAVVISGSSEEPVFQNAKRHLKICRDSAELFDPAQLKRYLDIQRGWSNDTTWDYEKDVIVIHAQAEERVTQQEYIVHINLVPIKFDRFFQLERSCRLYLHPMNSLEIGKAVDYSSATLWNGKITAIVRTELHPKNKGTSGEFSSSDFKINIRSLSELPTLSVDDKMKIAPRTQVVIRFDAKGVSGSEAYSLADKSPIDKSLQTSPARKLDRVDQDMKRFFVKGSIADDHLVYRPAVRIGDGLAIEGFDETMRPTSGNDANSVFIESEDMGVAYMARAPAHQIQPYFFLSKYAIWPKMSENERADDET